MTIFKKIFTKLVGEKFTVPPNLARLPNYEICFEQAVSFTLSCGFDAVIPTWTSIDMLDREGKFALEALDSAKVKNLSASAGQCLKWCHYLQPAFEKEIGRKVFLTIGQLWNGEAKIFDPSFDDMKRWSKSGIQLPDMLKKSGMNLHAWLTVESGEIVELTYLSTLAMVLPESHAEFSSQISWGREPHVLGTHRYFPMAVGQAFAAAISENSVAPFLATDIDELHSASGLFYLEPA